MKICIESIFPIPCTNCGECTAAKEEVDMKEEQKARDAIENLQAIKDLEVGMDEYISFLITVSSGHLLYSCAIKVKRDKIGEDAIKFYNEPDSRKKFYDLLPSHVQTIGKIVKIEEIFETISYT